MAHGSSVSKDCNGGAECFSNIVLAKVLCARHFRPCGQSWSGAQGSLAQPLFRECGPTAALRECSGSISGAGPLIDGSAAKVRVLKGWGQEGLVERADIGAGRDDLVDPVEDFVGERDVEAGE